MVKIELDNRYVWEYPTVTPLNKIEATYIRIPMSIILDDEIDARRVAVLSYIKCCCGLDDISRFSIPNMVTWCGAKHDKRKGGTNDKFLDVMDALNDRGYLTYLTEPSRSGYMECEFDSDKYEEECKRFGLVYLDEIHKILNYKSSNSKDSRLTNTTILLIFAYLRANIYRRGNMLRPEERNIDGNNNHAVDVGNRRSKNPEAYNDTFKNMASDLDISEKTFIKAVDILEEELGLIVTDRAYRIKNEDGEFRTPHTIFANAYKREKENLLASGEEYSRKEIEAKAEMIRSEFKINYEINKEKRKKKK